MNSVLWVSLHVKCSPKIAATNQDKSVKISCHRTPSLSVPYIQLAFPPSRGSAILMSVSSQHIGPAATQPSQDRNLLSPQEKPKAGDSWRATEQHVLPYNRLGIVLPGLMACTFLVALDQTIVAVALPTIVAELGEGKNYSWVGSAYFLAGCAFSPLHGKLSDLIGRKPVLYSSIFIFLLGSALCGAAKSLTWLIICRAVQGVGGGGIIQLVQITISDIVSLRDRGKYMSLISITYATAGVVGPPVVGLITDRVSWRWCFWLNLPTGGITVAMLFFFLNLNPHQGLSLWQHLVQFDFLGLAFLISGAVCVLIGLNNGETTWSSAETIALLCVGCTLLILAAVNEISTTQSPIIPPRLFKTRTTTIILITSFLHSATGNAGSYYLPLYYQVLGSSAVGAGIRMIPFSFGSSIMSVAAGITVSRTGAYRGIIWAAWAIMILGWGLMTNLDDHSNTTSQVLYPLIAGASTGFLYQPPLIALQAAMPLKDMATTTGAYGFLGAMGGTIGISIGQAIYTSILKRKINRIPELSGIDTSPSALSERVTTLHHLSQPERGLIIHAYARSISAIWVINTLVAGVGFILVLFMKAYSLKRTIIRGGARVKPDEEMVADDITTKSVEADETDEKPEVLDQSLEGGGAGEKEHMAVDTIGFGSNLVTK
ncbi:MFS general substrate transporter [Lactarius quietus]|nr:MFS general substrate transporter [Lactarius quietus]